MKYKYRDLDLKWDKLRHSVTNKRLMSDELTRGWA